MEEITSWETSPERVPFLFFLVFEAGFNVAQAGVNSSCNWGWSSMILLPQPPKCWDSTTSSFMKCQRLTLSVAHFRQEVYWRSYIPAQNLFLSIMPSQELALGRRWYSLCIVSWWLYHLSLGLTPKGSPTSMSPHRGLSFEHKLLGSILKPCLSLPKKLFFKIYPYL